MACFEPLIQAYKDIRTRGDDEVKFVRELNPGQQALFLFRTYDTHVSKSAADLYWWSAYYMAHTGRWTYLKKGLQFFGDHEGLTWLEDVEQVLIERGHPRSLERFDVSTTDWDQDLELMSSFEALYDRYLAVSSKTVQIIGSYIRSHDCEFVEFIHN